MTYRDELLGAIDSFRCIETLVSLLSDRSSALRRLNTDVLTNVVEFAYPGQGALVRSSVLRRDAVRHRGKESGAHGYPFQLYIRKRPLCDAESSRGVYDVVNTDIDRCSDSIIVHNGQLARNGRRLTMTHKHYAFARVLGAQSTNLDFCRVGMEPLIRNTLEGLTSTLLCYGQTGTGKTYTLTGALDYAAARFAGHDIDIIFYEVHSNKCYDLLNNRTQIHLRSDAQDVVQVRGANKVQLSAARYSDIKAVFDTGMALRASEETERNPISSRSHAVCVISVASISPLELLGEGQSIGTGSITFVDLAGSERNYETFSMTAAKHRESADINYSLMALKNCFRSYHEQLEELYSQHSISINKNPKVLGIAKRKYRQRTDENSGDNKSVATTGQRVHHSNAVYRASLLTRILKGCFSLPSSEQLTSGRYHRTAIIATVSPSAVDAQHTINTLDHVSLMDPRLQAFMSEVVTEVPKAGAALSSTPMAIWTSAEVNTWLSTVERGRFAYLAVPPQFTGADLLKLDATSLSNLFAGQMRQARAGNEGEAWTVEGESSRHLAVSRALWTIIRREIEMSKSDFF